ncbi:SNF2 family N-terminal domain-containing protein [Aspergillus floccosus]
MAQMKSSTHDKEPRESSLSFLWETGSDISELSTLLSTPRSTSPSSPVDTEVSSPYSPDRPFPRTPLQTPTKRRLTLTVREKEQTSPGESQHPEQAIAQGRLSFFSAVRDYVYPLLKEECLFRKSVTSIEDSDASIRPNIVIHRQPEGLRAVLKPYQVEGLSFLLYLRENGIGGILGDEMGLGKTLQTLALFQMIKEMDDDLNGNHAPFLVVCPLSVLETWVSELGQWTPDLSVMKYHGSATERGEMKKRLTYQKRKRSGSLPDVLLTSYETLLSDVAWFRRVFIWRYAVLDEAHRIKNAKSKRAVGLSKIRARYKLVLTGTPIQNNLKELWSILHWLYPDVFVESSVTMFEHAFSLNDGVFDRVFFDDITEFLKLVLLRREKDSPSLSLSIPNKMEFILSVPLSELQRSLYVKILTGLHQSDFDKFGNAGRRQEDNPRWAGHEDAIPISPDCTSPRKIKISRNILMELRKCSIHPYLLDGVMPWPYEVGTDLITQSGKFQVLSRLIQRFISERKKVIVFSGFEGALDLCEDMLPLIQTSSHPFRHVTLDGQTPSAVRNLSTYLFRHDERYLIFLISIRAGGEGLNLTCSSTIIFLDEDWNPHIMKQACARVHRIGQTKPVEIFRIQSRGTVEEQKARRLEKKAYMAERVMARVRSHDNAPSPRVKDQNPGAALTAEEEDAWLETAERVRTNIFDGKILNERPRYLSIFDRQVQTDLRRQDRRIGKERTVTVDGFQVSKESIACNNLVSPKSPSFEPTKVTATRLVHEDATSNPTRPVSCVISATRQTVTSAHDLFTGTVSALKGEKVAWDWGSPVHLTTAVSVIGQLLKPAVYCTHVSTAKRHTVNAVLPRMRRNLLVTAMHTRTWVIPPAMRSTFAASVAGLQPRESDFWCLVIPLLESASKTCESV